ncbi:MAG: Beta-mannanase [Microgenomates group bacterium GW2011_GWA1_48_10]|nr:MAG: Beta-mannanase [Microgenomates group bacterium GW2011_GWA1_48_10]
MKQSGFAFIFIPIILAATTLLGLTAYKQSPQIRQEVTKITQAAKNLASNVEEAIRSNSIFPTKPGVGKSQPPRTGLLIGTGAPIDQALGSQKDKFCETLTTNGSTVNWLVLSWARIQPVNRNQWVWKQFDNWVDSYESCGQEIMVHLVSNASWATQPFPPDIKLSGNHSMPPKNWDDYYKFVYEVTKHYKGKITHYSVENEAHWPGNWGASREDYTKLLQNASKAVHAADPNAVVTDAGMSYEGLGYLTANWLVNEGRNQEALDFANSYTAHQEKAGQTVHFNTIDELKQTLAAPGVQDTIAWENNIFANHKYIDKLQIHNGAPWQNLEKVLEYLHTSLKGVGDDKPISWWEAWYGWRGAPGKGYDPDEHARELVRKMVIGFAGKVDRFVYWTMTDFAISEAHVGLIDNSGTPRPAAAAFKVISDKLTDGSFQQKLSLGSNVRAYEFSNHGKDIYILWSESDNATVTLPFTGAQVTDVTGKESTISTNTIQLTKSPVFVEPQQTNPLPPPPTTCKPRPACLDSKPACLLPEPAEGWCRPSPTGSNGISLGVYQPAADPFGHGTAVDQYTKEVGRKPAFAWFSVKWQNPNTGAYQQFDPRLLDQFRTRGIMPGLNWDASKGSALNENQPDFSWQAINSGMHDAYITQVAKDAAAYHYPFIVRVFAEMDGNWYPWGYSVNGNTNPADFVAAWKHVVDIFRKEGATNVQFAWCWAASVLTPSRIDQYKDVLKQLYPGDDYVDWIALDGYSNPASTKRSLQDDFQPAYQFLKTFTHRRMAFYEVGASEDPKDSMAKANWITQGFLTTIPQLFPDVKMVNWFNSINDRKTVNYAVDSSQNSLNAWKQVVASPLYQGNLFNSLAPTASAPTPVVALSSNPAPTPPSESPTRNGSLVKKNTTATTQVESSLPVTKVEFYVKDSLKCTDTTFPYSCSVTLGSSVPSGQYLVTAKVTDSSGKSATNSITVFVN